MQSLTYFNTIIQYIIIHNAITNILQYNYTIYYNIMQSLTYFNIIIQYIIIHNLYNMMQSQIHSYDLIIYYSVVGSKIHPLNMLSHITHIELLQSTNLLLERVYNTISYCVNNSVKQMYIT